MSRNASPHDISVAVDEENRLAMWNRRAADLVDGDGNLDGRDAAALVAAGDRDAFVSVLDRARETGYAGEFEFALPTAEAGLATYEMTARCLRAPGRNTVYVTLTGADGKGIRGCDTGFAQSFVDDLAHDLSSPLSVVEGRLRLARETDDLSHLDEAEAGVDRIHRLVDDVLTLAGTDDPATGDHEVPLGSLVRDDAWTAFETETASLEVGELPAVDGEYDRIRRLFENLFRNAVTHTDGDVRVTVGALDGDAGFYVADTGPGVPAAAREHVFERGYSDGGGTGLGLAIVRQIADEHGWTVGVTDSETGGARFEFRFA